MTVTKSISDIVASKNHKNIIEGKREENSAKEIDKDDRRKQIGEKTNYILYNNILKFYIIFSNYIF